MLKEKFRRMFEGYKTRFIINVKQSGVVICNTSITNHIYFVMQDVNELLADLTDSFVIQDVTSTSNSKIICEYDKENDCLAFMDSIQYRKVILKLVREQGIEITSKIIELLNKRNIKIEDDYFLDVQSLNTVFDFLFNAPLGRKPTEEESVVSVEKTENVYKVTRGSGEVKYYLLELDARAKKDKKIKEENTWNQLGFICKELR